MTQNHEANTQGAYVLTHEIKDIHCPDAFAAFVGNRPLSAATKRLAECRGLVQKQDQE